MAPRGYTLNPRTGKFMKPGGGTQTKTKSRTLAAAKTTARKTSGKKKAGKRR